MAATKLSPTCCRVPPFHVVCHRMLTTTAPHAHVQGCARELSMGDEEEPMDPKLVADEKCSKTMACAKLYVEYEACASRIEKKGHGECAPYYMDYLGCVDRCVRFPSFRTHTSPHHACRRRGFEACADPPNLLPVPSAQAKDEIFKATK